MFSFNDKSFKIIPEIWEKTSVLVVGAASPDLGSISSSGTRPPSALKALHSNPDPPPCLLLRPVKRSATERPIDREGATSATGGRQLFAVKNPKTLSTVCGQEPENSSVGKMVEPTITLLEIPSRDGWFSSSPPYL